VDVDDDVGRSIRIDGDRARRRPGRDNGGVRKRLSTHEVDRSVVRLRPAGRKSLDEIVGGARRRAEDCDDGGVANDCGWDAGTVGRVLQDPGAIAAVGNDRAAEGAWIDAAGVNRPTGLNGDEV